MANSVARGRHGRLMLPASVVFAIAALVAASCNREPTRAEREATIAAAPPAPATAAADLLRLPKKPGSVRFAAIGDSGRGDRPQYEVSAQMQAYRKVFSYDFVVMLGDNIYDSWTPEDYRQKFELPYKPLLDAGVTFHAAIGNHDDAAQPNYPLFNMGGQRYYTFKPKSLVAQLAGTDVRFFMLDTERLDRPQLDWLDGEMGSSNAEWKIPIFHRPIYTSGRYAAGARALRGSLESRFVNYGVKVVFSGHEHFYERTNPQQGITYFISGGAGSLRVNDIRPSQLTAAGFDRDYHFMLLEISGDELYYQAITRTGATVDSGVVRRKDPVVTSR
jgi:hypothetical protein